MKKELAQNRKFFLRLKKYVECIDIYTNIEYNNKQGANYERNNRQKIKRIKR